MKQYKILSTALIAMLLNASCKKEDDLGDVNNIPGLGGDTWTQTQIDKYIYNTLTVPYNIAISYKWDQLALGQVDKNVVPVKEEQVEPIIEALKRVWIEPFAIEFGTANFKKYCPKFFIFAGSAAYNLDGSALLGQSGGGRQIFLFQLNYFRNKTMPGFVPGDTIVQRETFLTIEHEFTHIFDQNKQRPFEFDQVCQGFYSADWINNSDEQARSEGFITPYASSSVKDDFAETVSFMLVYGKDGFDEIIDGITGTSSRGTPAATAQARLRQKVDIVTKYFLQSWNIDMTSLQARTRAAIDKEFY